ncbi:hypothetical protein Taro_024484, partial [Colocasia esculenta]|nr:hypothetical protein [Colocasia esculenta]
AMTSSSKRDARAREYEQRRRVRRFVIRLNPSLRARLLESDPRTLDEALSAAKSAPQSIASTASEKPKCVHCSKHHGGNLCWKKEGRCLKCGGKDHRIRECPMLKKFVPRGVTAIAIKKPAVKPQAPTKENVLTRDDIDDAMTSSSKRDARAREYEQRRRVRRFVIRLNPSLRARLLESDPRTLDEALSAAKSAPQSIASTASEKPKCVHCSKHHGGNLCWKKEGRCLKCGDKDHRIRECPRLKKFVP